MEGLKRFAVMATGLATILVGCTFPHRGIFYGTTFFTYDLPHYVWDRKHFDYYLPLNTWVDDSVRVHTLEANIKHVKAKDSDKRSTADIAVDILQRVGYRCVVPKEPPDCAECRTCTLTGPGEADSQEMPRIDGRLQVLGTMTSVVYVGPGSDVRAFTNWQRPPVHLETSP